MRRIAFVFLTLLSGCATVHQLNDPSRSKSAPDVTTLANPRDVLYETAERSGIVVSYNILTAPYGLKLTLIFRNRRGQSVIIVPKIRLQDATGFILEPYSYEDYVRQAAIMAGTPAAMIPATAPSTTYESGTIMNPGTGATQSYYGTTTAAPNIAQSVAQGVNQSVAMASIFAQIDGEAMLQWANSFWLKNRYELPAGLAVAGGLMYPPRSLNLPLKLFVEVGGENFEFTTATQAN
ncbi:MAG TPA: hypothetical protein VNE59_11560 [Burkholderiales bacterium]|nr:hypothetical protein [Burkholderiales bacterium]